MLCAPHAKGVRKKERVENAPNAKEKKSLKKQFKFKIMTKQRANAIYDLLVTIGGAREDDRDDFVTSHSDDKCTQWRFFGRLGFGGKYFSQDNIVSCYREDMNEERKQLIEAINAKLSRL